jgi:hypothetical protein
MPETCLGGRCELYSPAPMPADVVTSFCLKNRQSWLKSVVPEVVKYYRLPRPVNIVLDGLGTNSLVVCMCLCLCLCLCLSLCQCVLHF